MIELTKLNGERILINPLQIEYVETIPESKVIMMNGKYHIVSEDMAEIKRQFVGMLKAPHLDDGGEA